MCTRNINFVIFFKEINVNAQKYKDKVSKNKMTVLMTTSLNIIFRIFA